MSAQYAFFLDAASCTGCKACQAACKDKNNLPPGVLWRRVYEVAGGDWQQQGGAWTSTVFAYNLSLACNHCEHAKCAGVCPVDAYTVRADGIVLLDSAKCIGCGYCAWACPYGAPQYDRSAGRMTKCNFCFDNIDAGLPPACTAACPMRALEYGPINAEEPLPAAHIPLWDTPAAAHPFPLPNYSRTRPHTAIKPHPAMGLPLEKQLANLEEVKPLRRTGCEEAPLVAFTLLAQAAVGGFWTMHLIFAPLWARIRPDSPWLHVLPLLFVGACLGLAMFASFSHLGNKHNAWRAVFHLRKSWLSREILFSLLLGAAWLAVALAGLFLLHTPALLAGLASGLGLGLLYSMAQVYHLRAVPAWNTWRTDVGFLISAFLLGPLMMSFILSYEAHATGTGLTRLEWVGVGAWSLLFLFMRLLLTANHASHPLAVRLWRAFMWLAIFAVVVVYLMPVMLAWWAPLIVFLLVLIPEIINRWLFYEGRP